MSPHTRAVELARLVIDHDYLPVEYDPLALFDAVLTCPPDAVPADGVDDWLMDYMAAAVVRLEGAAAP